MLLHPKYNTTILTLLGVNSIASASLFSGTIIYNGKINTIYMNETHRSWHIPPCTHTLVSTKISSHYIESLQFLLFVFRLSSSSMVTTT